MQQQQRFHSYELNFSALTAATGSGQDSFLVESNYDFYWMKSEAFVYDAAGLGVSTLQWPNIEVLMQDGASQQQLSNRAVALASLFGTGQIPYILPKPHAVYGGATFNATVYNKHTTTAYSVRLLFSGIHVDRGAPLNKAAVPGFRAQRRRAQ